MNDSTENDGTNKDPITGEPGAHPLGTGAGTAGGGLAGAAIGAAVAGPVGAAVGAVVGGVAGAYSGHGVAEAVNPTREENHWKEQHASQPWASNGLGYELYALAYRTGYGAATQHAGKRYEEIESDLAFEYQKANPASGLPWDRARPAVKAAWDRVSNVVTPRGPDRGMRGGV